MDVASALDFARQTHDAVLTTLKRDGRAQLSNITYDVGTDGTIRISVTAGRAKFVNLTRDPRASLHVTRSDFQAYVVLEANAVLAPVASAPDDSTVDELVELYRGVGGEHPDWTEYRQAMVDDQRSVIRLTPVHAYGWLG